MEVFTDSLPSLPCNWDVAVDCCGDAWADYTPEIQEAASEYGALTVWAATGRRFGLCERVVRPCGRQQEPFNQIYGYWWTDGTWMPYIFNGAWRNCAGCQGSSFGCCTCEPRCQVYLPPPVASIPATGVSIDGEILDVDAWRVDNGQWLVRTDGECWPFCQDYNVDTGEGVFQVTYMKGQAVPSVLLRAAGELACEWAKNCVGAPCRLPQRITSIARQGVSVSLVNIDELLKNGLTGLTTVDQVIRSFNPYSLTGSMRIHSPDWPPANRVTTFP